jgi:hypothetical protein
VLPKASGEAVRAEDMPAFSPRAQPPAYDSAGGRYLPRAPEEGRPMAAQTAEGGPAGTDHHRGRPAVGVLADRLAAALVHHEPGWRLPRHTALARRYNVSTGQIDAAIAELVGRHLIRRLPDGQLYRVSPAEYLVPLEGVAGLGSRVDPMGGDLTCRSHQTSWRRVPEDIGWALHVENAEAVCVVRAVWAASGEPAAYATTYLTAAVAARFAAPSSGGPEAADEDRAPEDPARADDGAVTALTGAVLSLLPLASSPDLAEGHQDELAAMGRPAALHVEMQLPPPSVARSLRLAAGQPAAMVTVRFDDPATGTPLALTVAVMRPDLFRIVVQTAEAPLPDGGEGSLSGSWTHAVEDWEP